MRKTSPKKHSGKYEVGKGRPPLATRWKRGQSGNPRGRPRGTKNLVTFLADALNEKLEIQERGKTRPITAREAIIKRIVHEALKGNLKAANLLLGYEPQISQHTQAIPERLPDTASPQERTARAAEVYFKLVRGVRG
jgi:hypothetical protein